MEVLVIVFIIIKIYRAISRFLFNYIFVHIACVYDDNNNNLITITKLRNMNKDFEAKLMVKILQVI
jgi:hypothetical protein